MKYRPLPWYGISGKGRVEEEEIQVWLAAGTIVSFVLNNNLTVLTKVVLDNSTTPTPLFPVLLTNPSVPVLRNFWGIFYHSFRKQCQVFT
jgi:hypothetical protein